MFIGTVPSEARGIIGMLLKNIDKKKEISVCCSGNFTIDKIAASLSFPVRSNDISIYSKAIADIVQEKPATATCRDEFYSSIFNQWEDHRFKPLIEIMFVIHVSPFEKQKNQYQAMMWENYISNHQEFYKNTIEKLTRNKSLDFKIKDFFFGDFQEHFENSTGVNFIFAPTYKAGYEKLYKRVDEVFEYKRPSYQIFDSENADAMYSAMLAKKECVIYSDQYFPKINDSIIGKIRMKNGKRDIIIYSNLKSEKSFICNYEPAVNKKKIQIIEKDSPFTGETKIRALLFDTKAINYFKHLFMSGKVDYSEGGDFGIIFFADSRAFGFASFAKFLRTSDTEKYIFLQSDFVAASETKRISKLCLKLLKSIEVQEIIMQKYMFKYSGMQTSFFTDKPVSMKYRSEFDLLKRDKDKLVYTGEFNNKSLEKNYREWLNQK